MRVNKDLFKFAFLNAFIVSYVLVLKLYSTTGIDKLSNPNRIPPTNNSIPITTKIENTIIINIVKNFDSNILYLLYGFTNSNLIVLY